MSSQLGCAIGWELSVDFSTGRATLAPCCASENSPICFCLPKMSNLSKRNEQNSRSTRDDELDVHDDLPLDGVERVRLVTGDYLVACYRRLESTRQPRMRKKTMKRRPSTKWVL